MNINTVFVCVASKRASHSRTCRAEPYRQHAHAIARAYMGDTTTESLTYIISQASTSIYVYINIYLTCASRYTGGHTHTHKMSPAASSARAIAHTWTWRRCIHMRTRSLSITEVYSYLLRVPPVICTKTTIYKYTHVALYT
jgi:hypothetical protein